MKRFIFLLILFIPFMVNAQLPQRNLVYVLLYNTSNINAAKELYNYDPTQPVSANNPSPNTIQMPAHCSGLAVSPVLGSGDTTLTFYTTVNSTFWYYDHNTSAWVNTGDTIGQASSVNIGAGGGYIYTFQPFGFFPSVYKYDGTGNASFASGGFVFPLPYDLVADCSGNFYVMGGAGGIWGISKHDANGNTLQGYTLNNPNNWAGSGGMANLGADIYTDNVNALNFIHSQVVSGSSANTIDTTASMPYMQAGHRADDMATAASSFLDMLPLTTIVTSDTVVCTGSSAAFSGHVTNPDSNGVYQWYVNGTALAGATDSTFSYFPADGDTVTLHYTAGGTCGNITAISLPVVIHVRSVSTPVLTVHDTLVCTPGPVMLSAQVSGGNSYLAYHWSSPAAILSPADQPTIVADGQSSSYFIVTVTDSVSNACKLSITDTIHLTVSNTAAFAAYGDTAACAGDSVHLHARGGSSYTWLPAAGLIYKSDSDVVAPVVASANYTVRITNTDGCSKLFDLPVTMRPPALADAGPDQYIKPGESVQLQAQGGMWYTWYPPKYLSADSGMHTTATPPVTTKYYVTVTGNEGCKAVDSVIVYVMNAFVPTAFTPNCDGLNDELHVRFNDAATTLVHFSIFNRWGERVFYTNNMMKGWDGRFKGTPSDAGSYYYMVVYAVGTKSFTEKGAVTLVR
jgi:gliding motility-associated-like protein